MLASPGNTLRRGFSITRTNQGAVLRSVKKVREGDVILTQVSDGSLKSRIDKSNSLQKDGIHVFEHLDYRMEG